MRTKRRLRWSLTRKSSHVRATHQVPILPPPQINRRNRHQPKRRVKRAKRDCQRLRWTPCSSQRPKVIIVELGNKILTCSAPNKIKSPRRIEHDNESDESDLPDLEETPTDMNDFLPQLEELEELPKLEEIDTNSKPKRKRKSTTLDTAKVPHLSPVKRHRRGIRRKPTNEAAYV